MDDNTIMNSTDTTRFTAAKNATIWDPRADLDDDGDVDAADQTLFDAKDDDWDATPTVTVAQAFSDVGNPYMFQGVPHFALDTAASATSGKLMLNHHRARFEDCGTGQWTGRDPLHYSLPAGHMVPPVPSVAVISALSRAWCPKHVDRWESPVPSLGSLSPEEGFRLYSLFRDEPTTFVDPSGMVCHTWTDTSPESLPFNCFSCIGTECTLAKKQQMEMACFERMAELYRDGTVASVGGDCAPDCGVTAGIEECTACATPTYCRDESPPRCCAPVGPPEPGYSEYGCHGDGTTASGCACGPYNNY
jgi:hypothetical protein